MGCFKGTCLCIPCTSLRYYLIWEPHVGDIASHFGRDKTIPMVEDWFFWPNIKHDVTRVVSHCHTCHKEETKHLCSLPIPHAP